MSKNSNSFIMPVMVHVNSEEHMRITRREFIAE